MSIGKNLLCLFYIENSYELCRYITSRQILDSCFLVADALHQKIETG